MRRSRGWRKSLFHKQVLNAKSPDLIVRHEFNDRAVAFSRDGRQLAIWHEDETNGLKIIDLTTGHVRSAFDLGPLEELRTMTFTPDGAALAFGAQDRKVRLWHLDAVPNPSVLRGHAPKEAWSLAFSPDGHTLASAGDDHRIRLWNVATGEEKALLRGHYALVTSVAFAPDGLTLASASLDGTVVRFALGRGEGDSTVGAARPHGLRAIRFV